MNRVFAIAAVLSILFGVMSMFIPSFHLGAAKINLYGAETISEGRIETVVYKRVGTDSLAMDVYYPLEQVYEKTPVILFYHGGSWVAGNKETIRNGDRKELVHRLREEGYAIAAVQYRTLSPLVNFPENIIDCQDAVRYIRSVSEEEGYDCDNIGVWGTSAGAHLGLMAATMDQWDDLGAEELKDYDHNITYMVDYFGPTTLPALLQAQSIMDMELVQSLFGESMIREPIDEILGLATYYSPISHVDAIDFPMLVVHGESDGIVSIEHSERLVKALEAEKKEALVTYMAIEDAGHGFLKENKSTEDGRGKVIEATVEFVKDQHE